MTTQLKVFLLFYKRFIVPLTLVTLLLVLQGEKITTGMLIAVKLVVILILRVWYFIAPGIKKKLIFYQNLGMHINLLFGMVCIFEIALSITLFEVYKIAII